MGNSASKAARKYPTRAPPSQPTTPHNASRATAPRSQTEPASMPLADSHRSQAIEKDGADPQFLSNLSSLGQVRVDHHMESIHVRPEASNIARLFESRARLGADLASSLSSSSTAFRPTRDQMNATALSALMDRRKSVRTKGELEQLARDFGIGHDVLERLTRFVNSPSIDKASIRPATGKSEEEGFVATAVWMEPSLK
ncbi:hypothetical protein CVT25_006448 [Psilocybe cyanescens]|uniref:Uncharacterized protein n=1 Tax=Psilocybe cyanescens TaxID=93625 RepID=A0A409XE86_PSICY|nr:hypothetical protein CVT25_006448 [Psilocybe cyanescens]